MQNFKSHFKFSKEQRNGIFLLLILIVILQSIYFFVDFSFEDVQINQQELVKFTNEIDSLKKLKLEENKVKMYPFNPNYITDYKGSVLGMSNEEIDRLLSFRKQNKWINSKEQFQDVTKVSDSLLNSLSPYFKFPEWVTHPQKKSNSNYSKTNTRKTFTQKQDLNTATAQQLQGINGVGKVFSDRIIKLRNKSKGGFISDVELLDVYGLTPEVIEKITHEFTVKTPRQVTTINLNTASMDSLVTIPHIDYDLAHHIIEQRQLKEGYKTLDEIIQVKDFPINKFKIIELYLHIEKEN